MFTLLSRLSLPLHIPHFPIGKAFVSICFFRGSNISCPDILTGSTYFFQKINRMHKERFMRRSIATVSWQAQRSKQLQERYFQLSGLSRNFNR